MSATAPTLPARPPLAVLVAISTLQPFALNVLAPATPGLARSLDTGRAVRSTHGPSKRVAYLRDNNLDQFSSQRAMSGVATAWVFLS